MTTTATEHDTATRSAPAAKVRSGRRFRVTVAALLAAHLATCVWVAATAPWTPDEPTYLRAGELLRAELDWSTATSRLHGPLPFYVNQLAAHLGVPIAPPDDYRFPGRLGMLLFTLGGAGVVTWFARRLFGPSAALWALALFALNPVLIAHGSLMATDMSLVPFWVLTIAAASAWLQEPRPLPLLVTGAALGAALATKYLGLFLVPVLGIGLVAALLRGFAPRLWFSRRRTGAPARISDAGLAVLAVAVTAGLTLWACYGFAPDGYAVERFEPMSRFLARLCELPFAEHLLRLVPEPFVRGVDYMTSFSESGGQAYLLGRVAPGFPLYYLASLVTMLPLGMLAAIAVGLVVRSPRWPRHAGVLVAAGILVPLLYLSLVQALQIGLRHMLQVLPLLGLVGARGLVALHGSRAGRFVAATLVAAILAFHVAHFPRYLGAFNLVVAGRPHLWFRDNNLVWRSVTLAEDPDERALRARHPDAERVYPASGPRLGRLLAFAPDLTEVVDATGRVDHWLSRHEPVDVAGPWLAFDVRPEDFPDSPHGRLERLIAGATSGPLGATERAELARLTLDDPRLAPLQSLVALEDQGRAATLEHAVALHALGRFDRVVDHPGASPLLAATAEVYRLDHAAARARLVAVRAERPLAAEEALLLAHACDVLQDYVPGIAALDALELPEDHPLRQRVADYRAHLARLQDEVERIAEQLR